MLAGQLEDRSLVALKGGGNLRFFFGSPRFSEDLDFDVRHIAVGTLRKKVEGILESPTLVRLLVPHGLRMETWSVPKQTDTVQRWKASIGERATATESTTLEFSRRPGRGTVLAEAVPAAVFERHRLSGPVVAGHYGANDAARQKLEALLGRSAPQARDVFDLSLLLDRGATLPRLPADVRAKASDRALGFSFDEFEGQVLEFLESDERAAYDSPKAFETIQERVAAAIEAAR